MIARRCHESNCEECEFYHNGKCALGFGKENEPAYAAKNEGGVTMELEEMRTKLREYCSEVTCAECEFYKERSYGYFCTIGNPMQWGRRPMVEEDKARPEEDSGMEGGYFEIKKAERVLKEFCEDKEECSACMYHTECGGDGCAVGCPSFWAHGSATKEQRKATTEIKDEAEEDVETQAEKAINKVCETHALCKDCMFSDDGGVCKVGVLERKLPYGCECEPKPTFTPADARKRILDDAITAVCSDRNLIYGEAEDSFGVCAGLWVPYIKAKLPAGVDFDLTAKDVAEMMILFKVGRSATALEDHRDTYVDIAGYAACAGGLCE